MNKNLMIYGILFVLTLSFLSNDIQTSAQANENPSNYYFAVNLLDNEPLSFSANSSGVYQQERVMAVEKIVISEMNHYRIYTASGSYLLVYASNMFLIIDGPRNLLIKVDRNAEDLKQIKQGDILATTKVDSKVLDIQTVTWGSEVL